MNKQIRTTSSTIFFRSRRGNANLPLIIGGVVVAGAVAVGLWFATGGAGVKAPPSAGATTISNPQAEAAAQAAGEKNLGNGGTTSGDAPGGATDASNQAAGEKNLGQ
jgi:hypothetical protein